MHVLAVLTRPVLDPDGECQTGRFAVVDIPRLAPHQPDQLVGRRRLFQRWQPELTGRTGSGRPQRVNDGVDHGRRELAGRQRHGGLLLNRRRLVAVALRRGEQSVVVGYLGCGERSRREPGTCGRHRRGSAVFGWRHEWRRRIERPELARRTHAFTQIAGALLALLGQVRGDRRANRLARVLFGAGAQRHEEADEATDLHQPVRINGLTGQLEEDVHRAALSHDAPAQVDEFGTQLAAEQLLVLVNDHHEAGTGSRDGSTIRFSL